jgi:hypothetical protein
MRFVLGIVLIAAGCSNEEMLAEQAPQGVEIDVVIPFETAVAGIATQNANNNLDVVAYAGRTFVAWRTAPAHFASPLTVMYVASEGPEGFRFEGKFEMGTDLREPRFLTHRGRLFLYFAVLGKEPTKFEPQGAMWTEYRGQGDWTPPLPLYQEGFIPWRAKEINGKAYVIGYVGGENIYEVNGEPIDVHFLTTEDGHTFEPAIPGHPIVLRGGASETDFVFMDSGDLIAVARNEAGDAESGWGSKICRAHASDLTEWHCVSDRRKFDSPLLLGNGETVRLIARRNLTESGNYDLERRDLPPKSQTEVYLADYSFQPKRCALWTVDPASLSVSFDVDLPSRGDTCFASALRFNDSEFEIWNYSNPLSNVSDCNSWPSDCADPIWLEGQGQPTIIYRTRLRLFKASSN